MDKLRGGVDRMTNIWYIKATGDYITCNNHRDQARLEGCQCAFPLFHIKRIRKYESVVGQISCLTYLLVESKENGKEVLCHTQSICVVTWKSTSSTL
jgi:hypothetical protein